MKNKFFVKLESSLELSITNANPATREALEQNAKREGISVEDYCANAVLTELEMEEL